MKRRIAVLAVVAGLALGASAADTDVASVDVARAKALALDAIKAKDPATAPSCLQYAGLTISIQSISRKKTANRLPVTD